VKERGQPCVFTFSAGEGPNGARQNLQEYVVIRKEGERRGSNVEANYRKGVWGPWGIKEEFGVFTTTWKGG